MKTSIFQENRPSADLDLVDRERTKALMQQHFSTIQHQQPNSEQTSFLNPAVKAGNQTPDVSCPSHFSEAPSTSSHKL